METPCDSQRLKVSRSREEDNVDSEVSRGRPRLKCTSPSAATQLDQTVVTDAVQKQDSASRIPRHLIAELKAGRVVLFIGAGRLPMNIPYAVGVSVAHFEPAVLLIGAGAMRVV